MTRFPELADDVRSGTLGLKKIHCVRIEDDQLLFRHLHHLPFMAVAAHLLTRDRQPGSLPRAPRAVNSFPVPVGAASPRCMVLGELHEMTRGELCSSASPS